MFSMQLYKTVIHAPILTLLNMLKTIKAKLMSSRKACEWDSAMETQWLIGQNMHGAKMTITKPILCLIGPCMRVIRTPQEFGCYKSCKKQICFHVYAMEWNLSTPKDVSKKLMLPFGFGSYPLWNMHALLNTNNIFKNASFSSSEIHNHSRAH